MRRALFIFLPLLLTSLLRAAVPAELQQAVNDYLDASSPGSRSRALSRVTSLSPGAPLLAEAIQRSLARSSGEPLVPGWNELRCSAGDGTLQPVTAYVPQSLKAGAATPLLVLLHGGVTRPIPYTTAERHQQLESFWKNLADDLEMPIVAPAGSLGHEWWTPAGSTLVRESIKAIRRRIPVDPNRIFLLGFSDGATGCWHFAFHEPDPFAAFIPLSGSAVGAQFGGPCYPPVLTLGRPVLAWNGDRDPLFPAANEKAFFGMLGLKGSSLQLHIAQRAGHDSSYFSDALPELKVFLKKKSRDPLPRRIFWATDNPSARPGAAWIRIREAGETGGTRPELPNLRLSPVLRLGVVVDTSKPGPGAITLNVSEGSAADSAGVLPGDRLISLGKTRLESSASIASALSHYHPGDRFEIRVLRGEKELTLKGKFPEQEPRDAWDYSLPFASVEARVDGNTIDIKAYRVARLELLPPFGLMDSSLPVKVKVNGKTVHDGQLLYLPARMLEVAASTLDPAILPSGYLELSFSAPVH